MSPEERKKLGINKSTLWHMKKNVSSKDKIKIYDKILDKMKDVLGTTENKSTSILARILAHKL